MLGAYINLGVPSTGSHGVALGQPDWPRCAPSHKPRPQATVEREGLDCDPTRACLLATGDHMSLARSTDDSITPKYAVGRLIGPGVSSAPGTPRIRRLPISVILRINLLRDPH
jgi:hypothetical protein